MQELELNSRGNKMPNILFVSSSPILSVDLREQLDLYAPEFTIVEEWSEDVVFDAAIVDEDAEYVVNLQKRLRQAPIIFLGEENEGFAESVIVFNKPLRLRVLLDRVLSCVNMLLRSSEVFLSFGGYVLDSGRREIKEQKSERTVKLTEREVMILNYLYKAHPKTVSKNELLSEVWGYNPDATTHTVETHIYRLRQKIEGEVSKNPLVLTEESGYSLNI